MTLSQFIEELFQRDVDLWINDAQLHYRDPLGRLTPELASRFEQYKATVLSSLRRPADKSIALYPLSSAQKTLWLLDQVASNSSAYNIKFSARILSTIDSAAFQRAFQALVDRHPSLRTTYSTLNEIPVQLVHEHQQIPFEVIDASGWSQEDVHKRMFEEADRPFDLERGPLFRVYLFSRSSEEHILWLLIHHIAVDICSFETLIEELGVFYASERAGAPTALPLLELQYKDYVHGETQMLASPEGEGHWTYLQKQLSGELPILNLPTDRPRPPVQTYNTSSFSSLLPVELIQQLKVMAQSEGISLYTTLVSAFFVLLYRYTSQEDILLGASTFKNSYTKFKDVAGYFVNELPLRADLSGNPTFREFLHKMHKTVQVAFEHQDYPSHLLAKRLHVSRDLSRPPLFQTIFTLQELHQRRDIAPFLLGQEGGQIELSGLEMESMRLEEQVMIFVDFQLMIVEEYGSFSAFWQYNTDLFDAATIERMAGHYQILLEGSLAHPKQRISNIPILTEAERNQILITWNDTKTDYPQDKCLQELFETQVERTPDVIAVVAEDEQLTYRELNVKSNQLAHHLQTLGVGPEVLVGICVERSLDMIVGLLGIMKAGGAYVPLDPSYPQERLNLMLEDAQVLALVTQQQLLVEQFSSNRATVVCLDSDWEIISQESQKNPIGIAEAENLAYVIYTSGSTGKPKGVQISQKALVNFLSSMRYSPGLTEQDILLAVTTISFDIAALEIYLPLIVGAQIVLASREEAADGRLLLKKLLGSGTTMMQATPVSWRLLLAAEWEGALSLKVLCGGEAMSRELADQLTARSSSVWNMYGPTETTIWSTLCKINQGEDVISIGRPIANTEVYILDDQLQPVPIGVPGELHIGGDGLAKGYLKRPELTDEKFIPHPFSDEPNARLYKTGDLARYLPDGTLECFGRLDHQVKIRGFRIELEEIEAVLISHSEVREAVVVALEDAHVDKRLVAYIVPAFTPDRIPYQVDCLMEIGQNKVKLRTEDISFDGVSLTGMVSACSEGRHTRLKLLLPGHSEEIWLEGEIVWCQGGQAGIRFKLSTPEQAVVQQSVEFLFENQGFAKLLRRTVSTSLRNYLNQTLPDYMVPANLILLDAFPLTPNGKVDRLALPEPGRTHPALEGDFVAPHSSIEMAIADIWCELLDLKFIGTHDNFFELGGNSLTITRVASRLRNNLQIELPISKLFEIPTIAELAGVIEKNFIKTGIQMISRRAKTEPVPLSFAQQRLWFLEQLDEGTPIYNIPFGIRLTGPFDIAILEQSINEIVRHHEALRTKFTAVNGLPQTVVVQTLNVPPTVKDLRGLPESLREAEAQRLIHEEIRQSFDLTQCPLFHSVLLRLDEEEYIFLMTIHHIIFDGWSIDVFMQELTTLYETFSTGKPSSLPELPIQYSDFAQWQREWLQDEVLERQLLYWKLLLSGSLPTLELPTDYPRPATRTFQGKAQSFVLSKPLSDALRSLSQQERSTPFMTLLAAFKILLYRHTGQEDIVVGSPVANRNRVELENLVGFFVNTLVLRTELSGNPTFRELLGRVRGMTLGAQAYQEMPFDLLVAALHPDRELSRQPFFQVMFDFEPAPMQSIEFPGVASELMKISTETAMFDLTLEIIDTEPELTGSFEYNIDLFKDATITRMIGHFQTLLEEIVTDPEQRLSELPILTEAERHQILVEWNDMEADYPKDICIHELFEAQVKRTPHAVAVVFGEKQISYQELNQKANQFAHYLQRLNAGPEVFVGICMERSLEMLVGLLGILKSGATYMPMDPANPTKRLAFMLEDTNARVLVTQQHLREKFSTHKAHIVCLDTEWDHIGREKDENPYNDVTAENLAYIIYTSGSTGIPKGVPMSHKALVNRGASITKYYGLDPRDQVLQFASMSFDVSLEEIFPSLFSGATIVLKPDQELMSFEALLALLKKEKLTVLNLPTTYWHEWVSEISRSNIQLPSTLRLVIVGTEQASAKHLATWQTVVNDHIRWINAYGPTEAAITTTLYESELHRENPDVDSVPIGRPIANTEVYILDSTLQPVPIGVPGELYIGGVSLARGYLDQPELSAEKFIPNPFSDRRGARFYKTGDLARYLADGNIEFLGRIDQQVKVRGFRIELGEIEAVLRTHPSVLDAVLIATEKTSEMKRKPSESSIEWTDPEALTQQLLLLDKEKAEGLLAEVETLSDDEIDVKLPSEVPFDRKQGKTIVRKLPEFEASLHIKDHAFIAPPSESQRNWILQKTFDEFVDDITQLDNVSKHFVTGSERAGIQHEWRESQAHYDDSQLIIEGQQVMQDWERPLMKAMAQIAAETHGHVLEVGFGMGISATYLQELGINAHTIIEYNDDVVKAFSQWKKQYPNSDIRLIHGKWQDVIDQLDYYDAILFDTYPLDENEFLKHVIDDITFAEHFFPIAADCLRKGGVFTYYTNEIDSFSRRHQRLVFKYFSSFTLSVVDSLFPSEDNNYWWANSMVVIKAVK